MKRIPWKLLLYAGLLLALVTPAGAALKGYHLSGVTGQVTGFTEPYQYIVEVFSGQGKFVTQLMTEPGGAFTVGLKPGAYVLRPLLPQAGPGSPTLKGLCTTVIVQKKTFTEAVLPFFLPQ